MHVLRLILVFHMVSQHPIKNSLEKKNMQNNMDFQRKIQNLFKAFSNESMTPVWSRRFPKCWDLPTGLEGATPCAQPIRD